MRFTRIRLNGFKSFVDPTELVIQDGLSGIVGPNGCGKSNLLEALRWVMGENRPTAMRGDGMEDVIFAGAASRPARHFAEVAVTIDNAERLAPAGFNDEDHLEITRRITRDAGSAYRVNHKEVRARDVQMLFADASTGSHSPALVRQGQIAELINARPRSRRRILEEAAGISGLYQRRHEAELKLAATEQNLARVDDVLEKLAQQLASLERQARQAARYREIGEALGRAEGILLYRRWREADEARAEAAEVLRQRLVAAGVAETAATRAGAERARREAALPPLREEATVAAAILQRQSLERDALAEREARARQAIEALSARISQLERDGEREAQLKADAGQTIARLETEAKALIAQGAGQDERLAAAAAAAGAGAEALDGQEAALAALNENVARLTARHHSAQRLLADAEAALARSGAEAGKARAVVAEAEAAQTRAEADHVAARKTEAAARTAADAAEQRLTEADTARGEAQSREAEARATRSEAEGEAAALRAEAGALTRLVERDTASGRQVLDKVTVEKGFERALGAALADDLRAPEAAKDAASGWTALPGYDPVQTLPKEVRPLAEVVKVPAVLARRLGQIGLVARAEGARLQASLLPGQRLVSVEGDLWRWDGFRAGAEDAPSAAALRMQQLNRLTDLKRDLSEAEARAGGARQAHELLTRRMAEAGEADRTAREARRTADAALAVAGRALSRAEADRSILSGRLESARAAVARHEEEAAEADKRRTEAEAGTRDLPDLDASRVEVEAARAGADAARAALMALRARHDEVKREGEARERRLSAVTGELAGWRQRLASADQRLGELAVRREESAAELMAARALPAEIAARREALAEVLAGAEARRAGADDALSRGEAAQREAAEAERLTERSASEAREARARAEARTEAAAEALDHAGERISEAGFAGPAQLLEMLATDPDTMPGAETLDIEVQRLKRQREALGAVNLRAEEDAAEVGTEHETLVRESADLAAAVKKLRAGIAGLNREGRERLLTAFEQVNVNFGKLFTHLFGGGEANLVLVESDDPLEAGLEIMCQPPGKKLATLSLLSGGEQTLTALALIFAVFLANPAPICVLDEVDAPLDDANVARFCDLLDEMTRRTDTRFLIITHHAVTMSRMDRLYGVTMQEPGVSQLVSVDLHRAEQLVA